MIFKEYNPSLNFTVCHNSFKYISIEITSHGMYFFTNYGKENKKNDNNFC